MSATAGLSGDFAVLIARLIAEPAGLETRLDAASAALEAEGMRVAAAAMLDFCGEHGITSDIELIPIQKINEAYDRLLKNDVKYRFVIDMASLK